MITIIILREESYLNSVARTYMMELAAEMLESIRDEMLPLAETWFQILSLLQSFEYLASNQKWRIQMSIRVSETRCRDMVSNQKILKQFRFSTQVWGEALPHLHLRG